MILVAPMLWTALNKRFCVKWRERRKKFTKWVLCYHWLEDVVHLSSSTAFSIQIVETSVFEMQTGHPLRIKPVCSAPLYVVQQAPREHSRASSMRALRDCLILYVWNEEQKCALIILGAGNGYVGYLSASLLEWREWRGAFQCTMWVLAECGVVFLWFTSINKRGARTVLCRYTVWDLVLKSPHTSVDSRSSKWKGWYLLQVMLSSPFSKWCFHPHGWILECQTVPKQNLF